MGEVIDVSPKDVIIYLAGGLFNAAERVHNLLLERELKKLGYTR